jgi:predicted DsbA family dithiol-disulfide isomerase
MSFGRKNGDTRAMGIQSEPEIVFNHRYLMNGGQPVEA